MYVADYLGLVQSGEQQLAESLVATARRHGDTNPELAVTGRLLAAWSRQHVEALAPIVARYGERHSDEPEQLRRTLFQEPHQGGVGLLRDLQATHLLAQEVFLDWIVLGQAARALRDVEFQRLCERLRADTDRQMAWLYSQLRDAASEILVVPV